MNDIFVTLVFLAVCFVLTGPAALIISIVALKRTKDLFWQIQNSWRIQNKITTTDPETTAPKTYIKDEFKELAKPEKPTAPPPLPAVLPVPPKEQLQQKVFDSYIRGDKEKDSKEVTALEQKIGTRWILIAGIITVFVGIGFFLKYAYDNFSISPLSRVLI
ncbi:MAG: hypothetical protein WCE45_01255, partial [Sedimentisphaerales bacterium]